MEKTALAGRPGLDLWLERNFLVSRGFDAVNTVFGGILVLKKNTFSPRTSRSETWSIPGFPSCSTFLRRVVPTSTGTPREAA
jgi:hypothetical protein